MSKEIGRLVNIGIAKEAVRGVAESSMDFYVPWMEITDPDNKTDKVDNVTSLGRLEDSDGFATINKYGQLGWKTKLKDIHPGLLLLSLTGSVSSVARSAPNAAVIDHTFSVLQSVQHPSLSLNFKDVNTDLVFPNAVVNTFKISATVDNYVMYEVATQSKASAAGTNTVAYVQENDFLPEQIVFKVATTQAGLDAAAAVDILSFDLTINSNTSQDRALGSSTPVDIVNKQFSIEGSITLTHKDATYSVIQNTGVARAMRFDIIHSATIGSTGHPELKIDLHKVDIFGYDRKIALDDLVEESFNFKAHFSTTDSKMATIVLTNTQVSY